MAHIFCQNRCLSQHCFGQRRRVHHCHFSVNNFEGEILSGWCFLGCLVAFYCLAARLQSTSAVRAHDRSQAFPKPRTSPLL